MYSNIKSPQQFLSASQMLIRPKGSTQLPSSCVGFLYTFYSLKHGLSAVLTCIFHIQRSVPPQARRSWKGNVGRSLASLPYSNFSHLKYCQQSSNIQIKVIKPSNFLPWTTNPSFLEEQKVFRFIKTERRRHVLYLQIIISCLSAASQSIVLDIYPKMMKKRISSQK